MTFKNSKGRNGFQPFQLGVLRVLYSVDSVVNIFEFYIKKSKIIIKTFA